MQMQLVAEVGSVDVVADSSPVAQSEHLPTLLTKGNTRRGRAVPSHTANSSGYVNASIVAPNSSAEIRFRYLMLSAYCGVGSAPDGDSVTVVRPFQANPVL